MNRQNPATYSPRALARGVLAMLSMAALVQLHAAEPKPVVDYYLIGGGGGGGAGGTGGAGGIGVSINGYAITNGGGAGNSTGGGGGGGSFLAKEGGQYAEISYGYNRPEMTGGNGTSGGANGGNGHYFDQSLITPTKQAEDPDIDPVQGGPGVGGSAGKGGSGGLIDWIMEKEYDPATYRRFFVAGGNAGSDGSGGKSGKGGPSMVASAEMDMFVNQLHLVGGNGSLYVNGTRDSAYNKGGLAEFWLALDDDTETYFDLTLKVTDEANPHDLHLYINSGKAYQGFAGGAEFGARSLIFEGSRPAQIDIINDTANGGGQYDPEGIEVRVQSLDLTKLSGNMTINAEFKPGDYSHYYTRDSSDGTPVLTDPITITFGTLHASDITGEVNLVSTQGIQSHHLFTGLALHNTGTFIYKENGAPAPFSIKENGELKLILPTDMSAYAVSSGSASAAPMSLMAAAPAPAQALWSIPGGLEIGSGATLALGAAAPLQGIAPGDSIQLFSADTGITGEFANDEVAFTDGAVNYTMSIASDASGISITLDEIAANTSLAKTYLEAYASGLIAVSNGYDQILGLVDSFRGSANTDGLEAFASTGGAFIKTKTGSHVDSDAFTFIAGVRYKKNNMQAGALFEAGWGDYDSYNIFGSTTVRGSGDNNYIGGGLFGQIFLTPKFYADVSFRAGNVSTDFRSPGMGTAKFDSDGAYYGAHIGAGYEITTQKGGVLDLNAKLIWTRQKGDTLSPAANEIIEVDAADSLRSRMGARHTFAARNADGSPKALRFYIGAAWEYEFDGEQTGAQTVAGVKSAIEAPDFGGSTAIGELGAKWKPAARWEFDAMVQGLAGKREGVAGSVSARFAF